MTNHEIEEIFLLEEPKKINKIIKVLMVLGLGIVLFILGTIFYIKNQSLAPNNFPINTQITIEQGTDIKKITDILQNEGVVKSKMLLYYTLVFFHEPADIKASTYIFENSMTTFEVAKKLTEGDFDTNLLRFTHLEGERASQIADKAAESLPNFDKEKFIKEAEEVEGRLFPDTYFIPVTYNEKDLLKLMLDTFEVKIEKLQQQIDESTLSLDEIIILASIIEREANDEESMKLVSSVLQNRLKINMPLQADASVEYILNKPLSELTAEDLKVNSPYNTYLNIGLPPTPIGNPGLNSIEAVLKPAESNYLYYITDDDGIFHYAKTYKEHLINIEKYLR